jgi:hypothetical protein
MLSTLLLAALAVSPADDYARAKDLAGHTILFLHRNNPGAPANVVPVLQKLGLKVAVRDSSGGLPKDFAAFDEVWIVSSMGPSPITASDLPRIREYMKKGGGLYVLGDNTPLYAESAVIGAGLHDITFDGQYLGEQRVHVVSAVKMKELIDAAIKAGNYDKLAQYRRAGLLNGKLYATDHELLTGLTEIYEGTTICHQSETKALDIVVRASDNQPLIAVSNKPEERIIYDCGFTRLYYMWEQNREINERWYRNVAAYLLGMKRADLATK